MLFCFILEFTTHRSSVFDDHSPVSLKWLSDFKKKQFTLFCSFSWSESCILTNGTSCVFVQHGGITCLFSSKDFLRTISQNMTVLEMGEKQPIVRSSRHTSFLGEHKDAHFWGHWWLRRMWGLKGDIFLKGVHSVCNRFKASLLLSSLRSVCLVWQMCGGLFGEPGTAARHVFTMSAWFLWKLLWTKDHLTQRNRATFSPRYFPTLFFVLSGFSSFFFTIPLCYFGIF